jgi:hypothetical protein
MENRRGVAIVIAGLAANAALDLSNYTSPRLAVGAWVVVLVGLVLALWPDLPERLRDRWRGDRHWKARAPLWGEEFPTHGMMFNLDPPGDHNPDASVRCDVHRPDGEVEQPSVRLPGQSVTDGVSNSWYFASYPVLLAHESKRHPIDPGPYRIVWTCAGAVGRRVLRVRRFRIRDNGMPRPYVRVSKPTMSSRDQT